MDKFTNKKITEEKLNEVAGGANSDKIEVDGIVKAVNPNKTYSVLVVESKMITAHLSGKMSQNYVKIQPGDKVKVEISPFDPTRGRISYIY